MLTLIDKITLVLGASTIIKLVMVAIVSDTIFGMIRSIKEHSFNSCFGINGAIRKTAMIVSIVCMMVVDCIVKLNLIGFIPEQIRSQIGLTEIGIAEFFGILYLCYEVVSILKNMYLCGLPVRHVWEFVRKFLANYTDELPNE